MGINERENNRKNSSGSVSSFVSKKKGSGGRPKANREIKKQKSFAILPSLYEKAQKVAYVDGKSLSEIISEYLELYIKKNADKLAEYDEEKGDK